MKHPIAGRTCVEEGCGKTVSRKWFLNPMRTAEYRCYEHGLAWKRARRQQRQLHHAATNPYWRRHVTALHAGHSLVTLEQLANLYQHVSSFQVPVQWRAEEDPFAAAIDVMPPRYVMRPEDDPDGGQS